MLSFLNSSEPPPSFSSLSCSLSHLTSLFSAIAPATSAAVVNFKVDHYLSHVTIPKFSSGSSSGSDSAVNTASPAKHFVPRLKKYSNLDPTFSLSDSDDNGNHEDDYSDALESEKMFEKGDVNIKIEKLGNNSRRIYSRIGIDAPLHAVWNILTDYERLPDFIPGLALSQIVHKTANHARIFQVGQQNLAFGLKFNAEGTIDCYEKDLERLPFGKKRVIKFEMIEGDFELFEGEWSIEQFDKDRCQDDDDLQDQETRTILSYSVDVKPKLLLPVWLLEGRLCDEIKVNLTCIREEVHKTNSTTC